MGSDDPSYWRVHQGDGSAGAALHTPLKCHWYAAAAQNGIPSCIYIIDSSRETFPLGLGNRCPERQQMQTCKDFSSRRKQFLLYKACAEPTALL